ncbi:MAG: lysophospholipid acyltransferase family protein [Anaerolineae bacterium]|nr:MAG: lysophospholipid acyltransferase family protein [Anaerolineae bacterium]
MLISQIFRLIVRIILPFVGPLRVTGQRNIPKAGPYIVAVNHMSKADPPLVLIALPGTTLKFFAGEKWERHLIFGPLMRWAGAIYINRGAVDRRALREALHDLEEGCVFGLAPEGTRSRIGKLLPARDGAAYLATRAKVPILPIGIVNTDQIDRNLRRLRRTPIEVRIGKLFQLPEIEKRPKSSELAAYTHYIMIHIAALLPERHWGYYDDSPALKALIDGEDPWLQCQEYEGVMLE